MAGAQGVRDRYEVFLSGFYPDNTKTKEEKLNVNVRTAFDINADMIAKQVDARYVGYSD